MPPSNPKTPKPRVVFPTHSDVVPLEDPKGRDPKHDLKNRRYACLTLSPQVIAWSEALTKRGLTPMNIATYLGITPGVFKHWLRKGKTELDTEEAEAIANPDTYDPGAKELTLYGQLYLITEAAKSAFQLFLIDRLNRPWNDQWRRDMAVLERVAPETWSPKLEKQADQSIQSDRDEQFA